MTHVKNTENVLVKVKERWLTSHRSFLGIKYTKETFLDRISVDIHIFSPDEKIEDIYLDGKLINNHE